MADLEQIALRLAKQGYAVFPLTYRQKTPITKHGYKDATTDPDQISRWWTENPGSNIGIACGEMSAHLVVIDIDNKHGHDGYKSLEQWQSEHGDIPDTLQVRTPNDGIHLYYRDMGHWSSPQNVLDGVDIRCNGSYVVAPGSVLESGQYRVLKDCPQIPSMINDSVKELLRLHSSGSESTGSGEKFIHKGIVSSNRHDYLMKFAGWLIKAYPDMTPQEVEDRVRQENETVCDPPIGQGPDDTPNEFESTVLKGVRKFKKRRDEGPPDEQIIGTNFTPEEWKEIYAEQESEEVQKQVEELTGELPRPVSLASVWNNMPPLAPVLIEGVLRVGHKMIISGPSKAGKSFLLIELAFAIAEGMKWQGCRCKQGKVLYLNMEIDQASFLRRIQNVYKAYGMNQGIHPENIEVWNLRGYSKPITELAPLIIDQCKDKGYEAIIVDPLYKVIQGDENSNSDIGEMAKGFDRIATETGCSIIYSHHFAKGNGGDRDAIDRGSGAGVFARDPDAIVTMTQIDYENDLDPNITAWRIEFVLREFPNKQPVDVFFEYPLHRIDTNGVLKDLGLVTTATKMKKAKDKADKKQNDIRSENIRHCAAVCKKSDDHGGFTTTDFMEEYQKYEPDISRDTVDRRLKKEGYERNTSVNGLSGIWHKE